MWKAVQPLPLPTQTRALTRHIMETPTNTEETHYTKTWKYRHRETDMETHPDMHTDTPIFTQKHTHSYTWRHTQTQTCILTYRHRHSQTRTWRDTNRHATHGTQTSIETNGTNTDSQTCTCHMTSGGGHECHKKMTGLEDLLGTGEAGNIHSRTLHIRRHPQTRVIWRVMQL